MTMQNASLRAAWFAAWFARDGHPIAGLIDMSPEQLERPLVALLVERCTGCGVLGAPTHATERGPRCACCEVS